MHLPGLERLETYAANFTEVFRRRDQDRWFRIYLQGLLTGSDRKNTASLARQVSLPEGIAVEDVAQALQNFVNQSPWDEAKLWQHYRQWVISQFGDPGGTLVIRDVAFPKKGSRSVGVHRQRGGERGKKINCQLAVAIFYVSREGCFLLALQLYLPRPWLGDPARLEALGVPSEHRVGPSKRQIALDLLAELRANGFPPRVIVANSAYGSSPEFRDALAEHGWSFLVGVDEDSVVALDRPSATPQTLLVRELVQEQRSGKESGSPDEFRWVPIRLATSGAIAGNSHHLLIVKKSDGESEQALGGLPEAVDGSEAMRMWAGLQNVEDAVVRMKADLGLDHFEGRSWRGFHHHACLVALAHGFRIAELAAS